MFLLLSAYIFPAGMFEQTPIGLSYANTHQHLSHFLLISNTHREWWLVRQRRIQGIANGKIYADLKKIVLQDDDSENNVINDVHRVLSSRNVPGRECSRVAEDGLKRVE